MSSVDIEINKLNTVPFERVEVGEFFTPYSDVEDTVYQRVTPVWSDTTGAATKFNAIKVSTGGHTRFCGHEEVCKLKGVMKLEYE